MKELDWLEGDGVLTATEGGSGNGTVSFSSEANEGIDRSLTVNIGSELVSKQVTVSQIGKREVYTCTDGEYICSDGGTYNVIKQEYYGV